MVVQESRLKEEQPQEQKSSGHYLSRASRGGEKLVKGFIKQRKQQLIYARAIKEKKTYVKKAKGYYFKSKQSNPYIEFLKKRSASFGFSPTLSDADQLFHDDWIVMNTEAETNFHSHAGRNESMEGSRVASQIGTEALIHSAISGGRNQSASVSNEALIHSLAGHAHTRLIENEVEILSGLKTIQATRPKFTRMKARRKKR